MTKRALFIGRFQPFHNGHLDAVKQVLEHSDGYSEIIIGIGSAENHDEPDNPLTAGERAELIDLALRSSPFCKGGLEGDLKTSPLAGEKEGDTKFWIIPIRDINNYSEWPHHVVKLCPKFDAIFSGSELVMKLFREAFSNGEIKVYELEKRLNISATEVREKIRNGEDISGLVSQEVEKRLEEIKIIERLQQ